MRDVLKARICPYCGGKPKFIDSSIIYGRSYGMVYYCDPCNAWVGVHKGTDRPLGRLANAELRELKKEAHKYFDPLWKHKMKKGINKNEARRKAYQWLAGQMGIEVKVCHVGMFDEQQCRQVVEICKPYYK